jgi:hypothetical protein
VWIDPSVIFRRRTLNEQLLRKAGLFDGGEDTRQPWDKAGIHGVHRPREWDDIATLAAELEGERAEFVVLDDKVIVEYGPMGVETLAGAISLDPPYRAEAVKREDGLWAVAARRIEVVILPDVTGRELEQAHHGGERTLVVDGQRRFGSIPALERQGDYAVRGRRLDGDRWEIEASLL